MTRAPQTPPARSLSPNDVISALAGMDGHFAAREQRVADFVQANLDAVTQMSIADLATASDVSTPTVVRFCRTLGCKGFRDFKMVLAQNLAVSRQYLAPPVTPGPTEGVEVLTQVQQAAQRCMETLAQQLDPQVFEATRAALSRGRNLLMLGVGGGSSMIAAEAANRFFRLGKSAVAESDAYLMQMRAASLRPGDVLLAFSTSGQATEVIAAVRVARNYGAATICVTRQGSPLAEAAEIALGFDLPEEPDIFKPTASRFAYLLLLDALALAVARTIPEDTADHLRRLRSSLTAYHGRVGPQPLGD
ncbi:MurR/RpiR family transcriptional regulator [Salipiger mangrovisoli]|uniref:MurR/RpiR family transcriptional regulator n=1 Tax=Salipiger mangrovisoli TaxID=2865933 RepID=A0ABR9X539_9RHOB|nr:MurR/RpiR family transcriptional regulator [Salipiger mangrovisoli]MBE9638615.1 MurR/RpiR family transcriptional regulator [Salipiger mangrovisoli]